MMTCVAVTHTVVQPSPTGSVLLAASAAWLGPAAETNRDLMFYWISQYKHREGGIFENPEKEQLAQWHLI